MINWEFFMKTFSIGILFSITGLSFAMQPTYIIKKEAGDKEIAVVASSKGGGGHESVFQALSNYLKDTYHIEKILPLQDALAPLDFTRKLSNGAYSCEDLYNKLLSKRCNNTINAMALACPYQQKLQDKEIQEHLDHHIAVKKPDVIISIIPFLNKYLQKTAENLQVPFIVIPTDLDTTTFMQGLSQPLSDRTLITIPFNNPEIKQKISQTGLNPDAFMITGFPVKQDFERKATAQERKAIRESFGIPENKLVCMLMMGAAGSTAIVDYTKAITQNSEMPSHTIVCLGRNEALRKDIEKIPLPKGQSLSVLGSTNKIADLMSVSHFILTKSGTVSVMEALKKRLPMIIDATDTPLRWEKLNHELIAQYKLGDVLKTRDDLPRLLRKHSSKKYRQEIKQSMESFDDTKFSHFAEKLVNNIR